MSGYRNFSLSSWPLAHSSLIESVNLVRNASSKWFHTAGTLCCTGWSLLRLLSMFLTHRSTFSPLIRVRAIVTCWMGNSKPGTPWLSIRYPRYSVRNVSALAQSPSKIRGRDPIGLISQAWGMGTWSYRPASSGSSSEGLSPPPPRSSSSRGSPPPAPLPWHQRCLRKALMRVALTRVSSALSRLVPIGKDPLDPPVPLIGSSDGWESC